MVLRNILAKRLSGLRKAGVETPIINEIPVPAEIVKMDLLEPYANRPEIMGLFMNLPVIAYGTGYGETAGQWYRVTYLKPIAHAQPVCVAEGRTGTIKSRAISRAPDVVLPTITIPKVGVRTWHCRSCDTGYFSITSMSRCPRCGSYTTEELTGSDRYEKTGWYLALWNAKRTLGDWGLLNWARDAIATVLAWFGYYLFSGNSAFILADAISTQTEQVQSSVQSAFNAFVSDLRSKLKSQIDYVTDAVNLRLNDLYAMWGVPTNMALTPVHIRNCTDTGFEFQSYGKTTVHFIAVGGKGG
jgi:hypothetical protein